MLLSYQKLSLNGFHRLCEFIRANYGINLTEAKRNLVINRLNKRLRSTGLKTIDDYIRFVFSDKGFARGCGRENDQVPAFEQAVLLDRQRLHRQQLLANLLFPDV